MAGVVGSAGVRIVTGYYCCYCYRTASAISERNDKGEVVGRGGEKEEKLDKNGFSLIFINFILPGPI